jgi:hypothetical protein
MRKIIAISKGERTISIISDDGLSAAIVSCSAGHSDVELTKSTSLLVANEIMRHPSFETNDVISKIPVPSENRYLVLNFAKIDISDQIVKIKSIGTYFSAYRLGAWFLCEPQHLGNRGSEGVCISSDSLSNCSEFSFVGDSRDDSNIIVSNLQNHKLTEVRKIFHDYRYGPISEENATDMIKKIDPCYEYALCILTSKK